MKKLILTIPIFVALAIIIQSSSCGKTDEPKIHCDSSNTAYIPSDARSRFCFKEGTFWVYKNIANNELDTLVVKDWYHTIEPPLPARFGDAYKNKCYERKAFRIISNKYGWHIIEIDFNNAYNQLDSTIEQYDITESSSDIDNFVTYRWYYRGGLLIDTMSTGKIKRLNNLEINSRIYSDIIHYSYKTGFETTDYLIEGWYANKIGLVKVIRKDGTT